MPALLMVSLGARRDGGFRLSGRRGCRSPDLAVPTKRIIFRNGVCFAGIGNIAEELMADIAFETQDGPRIELPDSDTHNDEDNHLPTNITIFPV